MNGIKKIPKGQLETGIVDVTKLTNVTLTVAGWSLVSGFYQWVYSNAAITSDSIVDMIPTNASIAIVKASDIMPTTTSASGTVTVYATNLPTADIIVNINIFN
jgi:hypothetical protein